MATIVLIIHGLLAVALLGAITHQALATGDMGNGKISFLARYRGMNPASYSGAVVFLFAAVTFLGATLYPQYRIIVRPILEARNLRGANGIFEIKEHFAAIGLLMLPAYWAAWKRGRPLEYNAARSGLTWIFAMIVWWNFLVGHVLNNIKGLFE